MQINWQHSDGKSFCLSSLPVGAAVHLGLITTTHLSRPRNSHTQHRAFNQRDLINVTFNVTLSYRRDHEC